MNPVRVLPTQTLMPQQLIGDGDEPFNIADDLRCPCSRHGHILHWSEYIFTMLNIEGV